MDWDKISDLMRAPAWIFDARSVISKEDLVNKKLNLWRIGDGTQN